jgi:hypothetical protein
MILHVLGIGMVITFIVVSTFLPFLPGPFDGFAVVLSLLAQAFGWTALLLVPIGVAWLTYESLKPSLRRRNPARKDRSYVFAIASVVALSIAWALASIAAGTQVGASLVFVAWAFGAFAVWTVVPRLQRLKRAERRALNPGPLYLTVVPIAVLSLQLVIAGPATEFSRNRAITNSETLVDEIEQYRKTYGRYPQSLAAVTHDYDPMLIGIKAYHYSLNGEAYNLYFEQISFEPGVQEVVMYNKLDEHLMPSHDSDVLRWRPEQLVTRRGYTSLHDTAIPHWKYFWFD